jgi:pimeloyl-ACP methyl ester carboxylesterase
MARIWKRIGIGLLIYAVALFTVAGALIGFGQITQPKPLKSVTDPFSQMDLSGLPPIKRYTARDGAQLSYRLYEGNGAQVAVLVHGSAGSSKDMHRMADALVRRGVTVFVPDLRGHGANYPHGDTSYRSQLDDDMTDFMKAVHPQYKNAQWTLVGFSSGGGFALRIAGREPGSEFDRFVFISPFLRYNAPTVRPESPTEKASPEHNVWYSVSRGSSGSRSSIPSAFIISMVCLCWRSRYRPGLRTRLPVIRTGWKKTFNRTAITGQTSGPSRSPRRFSLADRTNCFFRRSSQRSSAEYATISRLRLSLEWGIPT